MTNELDLTINEIQRICNKFIDVWRNHKNHDDINYGRVWGAAIASETILSIIDRSYDNTLPKRTKT